MSSSGKTPLPIQCSYDRDADVLYVSVGSPRAASTEELDFGVLLRRDTATGEIVGVTVLDYAEHFRRLPDVSWLQGIGLPQQLESFLRDRPVVTAG